jgi:hypothetical protein
MVPRLVEGGCLYCTLGGPGSIPVEAVRAFRVFFHDLVLLMFIRQENCTNQPALTHLPELWVNCLINSGHYYGYCVCVCFIFYFLFFIFIFIFILFYSIGIAWLFSIHLLCRRIELAYCMALVFIILNVCLTAVFESLNVCSSCIIDGVCVVPLAPAVMTMSGSIFHPCCVMSLISGWYFRILLLIVSCENLSFVYVNSINCTVRLSVGCVGGVFRCGSPLMHSRSGLNLALQWHLFWLHVHDRSQVGTVFSCGLLLKVPAFMRM